MLSSRRPANTYDASVYAPINECPFIPNCAYETLLAFERMPSAVVRVFISDSQRYYRTVAFGHDGRGFAGILSNMGGEIYAEASPEAPQHALAALRVLGGAMVKGRL